MRRACAFCAEHGVWVLRGEAGHEGGFGFYTSGMRPICFLSDFGLADDFVGTCKGVMLRVAPGVAVVDLTHGSRSKPGRRYCSTPPVTCRRTWYTWPSWTLG